MRHLTLRRALIALLLATATVGCDNALGNDSPADAPLVRVPAEVAVGATIVEVRLTNASATSWGYNPCSSPQLQRRVGDSWVEEPGDLIICTAELRSLGGGRALTVSYSVPSGLSVGTYRVRYRFLRDDGVEARPESNAFVVR